MVWRGQLCHPHLETHGVEWREPKRARFDTTGSALYAAALPALLLGFTLLPSPLGTILVAGGVVGIAAFLWWETRAADPLLDVDLFRHNRVFAFCNMAAFINYAATLAVSFLMSLYLQYTRGLNPQTAGFVLVAGAFFQAAFSPVAGRVADRIEPRLVASGGMGLCVLGLLGLVFVGKQTPYWYVICMLCLLGLGFAFFASPITHAVMGSVETRHVGVASSTLATVRWAGQNLSIGMAGLILATVVGSKAIEPSLYPRVLTGVRLSFEIFTVLCALGVGATLVGPRRKGGTRQPKRPAARRWRLRLRVGGYFTMKTIPRSPSTLSRSPVLIFLVASWHPVTAGSRYSRATITA